ncbi:hypothetical protein J1605_010382 [Eschrichtius robustus]|uniref:Uncharacterized protein n=1 Tax=Eschrichtius robustus TaxID=9764 RepID=A0AB34GUN3_ESCRO|nr:hypothetical protein J1605_010382 [Eschrichtius robustus]
MAVGWGVLPGLLAAGAGASRLLLLLVAGRRAAGPGIPFPNNRTYHLRLTKQLRRERALRAPLDSGVVSERLPSIAVIWVLPVCHWHQACTTCPTGPSPPLSTFHLLAIRGPSGIPVSPRARGRLRAGHQPPPEVRPCSHTKAALEAPPAAERSAWQPGSWRLPPPLQVPSEGPGMKGLRGVRPASPPGGPARPAPLQGRLGSLEVLRTFPQEPETLYASPHQP